MQSDKEIENILEQRIKLLKDKIEICENEIFENRSPTAMINLQRFSLRVRELESILNLVKDE